MGERKISKDWWKRDQSKKGRKKTQLKMEQMKVTKSEDLPELMTLEETANLFKRSRRTIERWFQSGTLRSLKVQGRWFTTPEFIADFLERENLKHG